MLRPLHPLHAIFLAGALPLSLGSLLADLAYASSYETQWKNFASWLVLGALLFTAVAALWAAVDLARHADDRGTPRLVQGATIVGAALLGLVNCLVHAGDGWQSMPTGAVLSGLVFLLVAVATAIGFSSLRDGVRS